MFITISNCNLKYNDICRCLLSLLHISMFPDICRLSLRFAKITIRTFAHIVVSVPARGKQCTLYKLISAVGGRDGVNMGKLPSVNILSIVPPITLT